MGSRLNMYEMTQNGNPKTPARKLISSNFVIRRGGVVIGFSLSTVMTFIYTALAGQ